MGQLVGPSPASPPTAWAAQMMAAKQAQQSGEFATAEAGFRSAMRIALEAHPDQPVYQGASANDLGQLYFVEAKFSLAESLFMQALARFREAEDRPKQGRVAANLSTLYLEIGEFSRAANTIQPYLNLPGGEIEELDWAILLSNLGSIRTHQQRLSEAEMLFRNVIHGLDSRSDPDSSIVRATAMSNLSEVLAKTCRQAEGEAYSDRSLAILEDFADSCPANLIRALTNVAEFRLVAGDLAGADALLHRAVALYESAFQADQKLLADVLQHYAVVLRREKRKGEAQEAERRAARIFSTFQHENHLGYTVEVSALK